MRSRFVRFLQPQRGRKAPDFSQPRRYAIVPGVALRSTPLGSSSVIAGVRLRGGPRRRTPGLAVRAPRPASRVGRRRRGASPRFAGRNSTGPRRFQHVESLRVEIARVRESQRAGASFCSGVLTSQSRPVPTATASRAPVLRLSRACNFIAAVPPRRPCRRRRFDRRASRTRLAHCGRWSVGWSRDVPSSGGECGNCPGSMDFRLKTSPVARLDANEVRRSGDPAHRVNPMRGHRRCGTIGRRHKNFQHGSGVAEASDACALGQP